MGKKIVFFGKDALHKGKCQCKQCTKDRSKAVLSEYLKQNGKSGTTS